MDTSGNLAVTFAFVNNPSVFYYIVMTTSAAINYKIISLGSSTLTLDDVKPTSTTGDLHALA